MQIEILEYAKLEIDNAYEYYNLQQDKLGDKFKNDVKKSIDTIRNFPKLYPIVESNIRRNILHRFPYSIYYALEKEKIIILAVAHQSRKPFYWIDNIDKQ